MLWLLQNPVGYESGVEREKQRETRNLVSGGFGRDCRLEHGGDGVQRQPRAEELLFGRLKEGGRVTVDEQDGEIAFRFDP